jgi:hypothetical protein
LETQLTAMKTYRLMENKPSAQHDGRKERA